VLSCNPHLDRVGPGTTPIDEQLLIKNLHWDSDPTIAIRWVHEHGQAVIVNPVARLGRPDQIRIDCVLFVPSRSDAGRASALVASNE